MKRGNCLSRLPQRTFYQGHKIRLYAAGTQSGTPPPTRVCPGSTAGLLFLYGNHGENVGLKFAPNAKPLRRNHLKLEAWSAGWDLEEPNFYGNWNQNLDDVVVMLQLLTVRKLQLLRLLKIVAMDQKQSLKQSWISYRLSSYERLDLSLFFGVLAGTCTVHGLALQPIMQERWHGWVISLKKLPCKAKGPLAGPGVNQGKPSPLQFLTQIKKHWWHHCLPI